MLFPNLILRLHECKFSTRLANRSHKVSVEIAATCNFLANLFFFLTSVSLNSLPFFLRSFQIRSSKNEIQRQSSSSASLNPVILFFHSLTVTRCILVAWSKIIIKKNIRKYYLNIIYYLWSNCLFLQLR